MPLFFGVIVSLVIRNFGGQLAVILLEAGREVFRVAEPNGIGEIGDADVGILLLQFHGSLHLDVADEVGIALSGHGFEFAEAGGFRHTHIVEESLLVVVWVTQVIVDAGDGTVDEVFVSVGDIRFAGLENDLSLAEGGTFSCTYQEMLITSFQQTETFL